MGEKCAVSYEVDCLKLFENVNIKRKPTTQAHLLLQFPYHFLCFRFILTLLKRYIELFKLSASLSLCVHVCMCMSFVLLDFYPLL